MPDTVVDADTINTFKRRLDKHWLNQDVVYNFYAELFSKRQLITLRLLYAMSRPSVVYLSVCLSVCRL